MTQVPVKRPIFVVGLPRTGTTHLFKLLGQDENAEFPYFWQMICPTPAGRPDNWRKDPRFTKIAKIMGMVKDY